MKDLLTELKLLSKLDFLLNYRSLVNVYEQLDDVRRQLQLRIYSDVCYWMETRESSVLLTTVDEEVFGVLSGKVADEDWMEAPQKWEGLCSLLDMEEEKAKKDEAERQEGRGEGSPCNEAVKRTVLISVLDGKSVVDIHNFLTAPNQYMLFCLQHALCRHIAYQTTSEQSMEYKLLRYLRERLRPSPGETHESFVSLQKFFLSIQDVEEKIRAQESIFHVRHRTYPLRIAL